MEREADAPVEDPPPRSQRDRPAKQDALQADDEIHRLINSANLYEPLRKPRYPIVLCHGTYSCSCMITLHHQLLVFKF